MKYDRKACASTITLFRGNWKSCGDEAAQPAISLQPGALVWRQTHLLREKNNSCMAITSIIKHERRCWWSPSGWAHVPREPTRFVWEVSFHEVTLRLTNIGKLISKDGSLISATRYWLTSFLWKGNEIKKGNKWMQYLHSHSDNEQLRVRVYSAHVQHWVRCLLLFSHQNTSDRPPVEPPQVSLSSQRHRIYTKTSAIKQTEGNLH